MKEKKKKIVYYSNITTRSSNQSAIELMLPKRISHTLGTQLENNEGEKTATKQKKIRPFRWQESKRTNEMYVANEVK